MQYVYVCYTVILFVVAAPNLAWVAIGMKAQLLFIVVLSVKGSSVVVIATSFIDSRKYCITNSSSLALMLGWSHDMIQKIFITIPRINSVTNS